MVLGDIRPGDTVEITGVTLDTYDTHKAMTLGFTEGATVRCVSTAFSAMEFNVHGARIAISKSTADKFRCEKIAGESQGD